MLLSDRAISARLGTGLEIHPLGAGALQPASVDLRLGPALLRLPYGVILDPEVDQSALWVSVPLRHDGRWCLGQGTLYLATTVECVSVPDDLVAHLHGLSSLGRQGLLVHVTAGLLDPGWRGHPTLELLSLAGSLLLRPGQRIAQVSFEALTEPAIHPYRGKYQGDTAPTTSRMYQEGAGHAAFARPEKTAHAPLPPAPAHLLDPSAGGGLDARPTLARRYADLALLARGDAGRGRAATDRGPLAVPALLPRQGVTG